MTSIRIERRWALVLACAAIVGCADNPRRVNVPSDSGSDAAPPEGDGGVEPDARAPIDAGLQDDAAMVGDGGAGEDSGSAPDSGSPADGGRAPDGGGDPVDAGAPDAGRDAGMDAGRDCGGVVCTLVGAPCGCEAGQACQLTLGGTRRCGTPGAGAVGSSCAGAGDCQAGLVCNPIGGGVNVCQRPCSSDATCMDDGSVCASPSAAPGVQLCTRVCEPDSGDGCPAGAYCAVLSRGGDIVSDCRAPPGDGGDGASCSGTADCEAGLTCARESSGSPQRCREWCRVDDFNPCSFDDCVPGSPAIRLDGVEYGFCL